MSGRRTPTPAAAPAAQAAAAPPAPADTATAPAGETTLDQAAASAEAGTPAELIECRQVTIEAGPDGTFQPGATRWLRADDPLIEAGAVEPVNG